MSRYEPPTAVEFCRAAGASRTCHLTILLDDHGDGTTTLDWTYTHTAVDEVGRRWVEAYSADRFRMEMEGVEARLQHYLRTGERLEAA